MTILWTKAASVQLEAAFDFVAEGNLVAARKQLEFVRRAVDQLANFPEMGRLGRVEGTRELMIHGSPYVVAYRVKSGTVRVLAILHGARRWPSHL